MNRINVMKIRTEKKQQAYNKLKYNRIEQKLKITTEQNRIEYYIVAKQKRIKWYRIKCNIKCI